MVPLSFRERLSAHADGFIFAMFQWLRFGVATVFILGIILVSCRAMIIGIFWPSSRSCVLITTSCLIHSGGDGADSAHNEKASSFRPCARFWLSDIPDIHVVVVDDGSADGTLELLQSNSRAKTRVQIIHQVNRGKAAALNVALMHARTEIVVTIDADTEVEPDAIRPFAAPLFRSARRGGGGQRQSRNRSRWLTRWAGAGIYHQPEHGKARLRSP